MAHIHHFRTLQQVQRLSLQEVRSPQHTVANFAAFCGARRQREAVGLHEMERCCGKRGVVLIHNDPQLEGRLGRIYDRNPLLRRLPAQFQMYLANPNGAANAFYDPLYGLSASYVLDILCPVSDDGFRSGPRWCGQCCPTISKSCASSSPSTPPPSALLPTIWTCCWS